MMKKMYGKLLCVNVVLVFGMLLSGYISNGAATLDSNSDFASSTGREMEISASHRRRDRARQRAMQAAAGDGVWRQGDFAGKLYRQMAKGNGNLAFSPYGVASVCALVGTGAKGETFEAFKNVLGFSTDNLDEMARIFRETKEVVGNAVEISDSVWLFQECSLLDDFRSRAVNGFLAEARNTSLERASEEINAYVSDKTHGKIPRLLKETPNPDTCMMAVNTIYLNAAWAHVFEKEMTRVQVFTTLSGDALKVPFMRDTLCAIYHRGERFSAVSLPYADSDMEMLFVLPDKDKNVALREIEEMISESFISRVVSNDEQEVRVEIPKFEFEMQHELVDPLREMGLGVAFSPMAADFSGLAKTGPNENIYLSDAVQKVKIKVDEKGTEAAAATRMGMEIFSTCIPPPVPEFVADHPFVFVLWDRASGAIFFMGRVMNPADR